LLLVGGFFAASGVLITKIRRLPLASESAGKVVGVQSNWTKVKVWNLRLLIALMMFSLVFGNWVERGSPLTPRIVGTIANLALTWLFVKNLRWLQMKSK